MNQFKVGDVVCLKSDKEMYTYQRMTVNGIDSDGTCSCVWFKEGEIRGATFAADALTNCDS